MTIKRPACKEFGSVGYVRNHYNQGLQSLQTVNTTEPAVL